MDYKIRKLLFIMLLCIICLVIPNSVKADGEIDKSNVSVNYTIKIDKIDTDTKELLQGAVFELKDINGNVISTATTDNTGKLTFDQITTLGEGTDVYYIEEKHTPSGYTLTEQESIEVTVTKIIDEDGAYKLKVECETLNYSFDISRYKFIPVATADALQKIGTDEEIEYEGVKYTYSANANYKLVADIDLNGINWEPINEKISGIFDGDGHSIKNLKIVPKDDEQFEYSEIGLFRYFSGIVQNLNLENVNIVVTNMDLDPKTKEPKISLSKKIGVGGFAGFMEKGIIKNCKIDGNIVSYYNNVGGFVGHSAEDNIIKFQNCTSSVKLVSAKNTGSEVYNAGGMIGCAIGSVSFEDCTFDGSINGNGNNIGGLAGFVQSTGYDEYSVKAGYSEDDNVISLLIGNSKISGKYDLVLENHDIEDLGLLSGAKYSVYDAYLEVIPEYENIEVKDGKLHVATVDINEFGTDIYYIKEIKSAPGYARMKSYIKVMVKRYWDKETNSFKVSVDVESIGDDKILYESKTGNTYEDVDSLTGQTSTNVDFENVGWNNAKALFDNCSNKGSIQGNRDVGGILGVSYCKVEMKDCKNYAEVKAQGSGKAAGLIAKIEKKNEMFLVKIQNCYNEGNIASNSSGSDCASGILGQVIADIEINNCMNKGEITLSHNGAVSGILSDFNGNAEISNCANEGNLFISSGDPNGVNGVVGGIIAKNHTPNSSSNKIRKEDNNINISNCTNTGNIKSDTHCGGIIGYSNGNTVKINECKNQNNTINGTASDKGGMMGFASVHYLEIKNCNTEKTELFQTADSTYGETGGILGNLCYYSGGESTSGKTLVISDCNVSDCVITSRDKETGGIFGGGNINSGNSDTDSIEITNCNVIGCEIKNYDIDSTYGGSGGIFGATYNGGYITIANCNVKKCNISCIMANGKKGGDTNTGGIIAMAWGSKAVNLKDNTVDECEIYNGAPNDSCANTGGIVAEVGDYNTSSTGITLTIDNCDVSNSTLTNFSGNIAGTLGMSYYNKIKITNCDNIQNTINSSSLTSSNSNTGGIISGAYRDVEISNCSVIGDEKERSLISGMGKNVSGVIAWCMGNITVNDTKVKNMEIKSDSAKHNSDSYNNDTTTGIIGYSNGTPKAENCLVENCIIDGYCGNSAGLLGSTNGYNSTSFKDITIKDTNISNEMFCARSSSNSTASGLIGYLGINNSSNSVKYENITIDGCNITGHGASTSGMISVCNGGDFDNCTVKNSNITKKDPYPHPTYTSVAGMIASSNYSNLYMNDCKIEKVEISGDCMSQGGFIGYCNNINEFNNNIVNNLTIIGNKGQYRGSSDCNGSIGGLIADFPSSNNIELNNCNVTNFIAETDYNHIGGIIGTTSSKITFNECNLDDLDLKYNNSIAISGPYKRCIGGIIGVSSGKATINNGTANNIDISALLGQNNSSSVGALIGYAKSANFSSQTNKESNVIIKDVTLDKNTILNETSSGMAGGVIGSNYCYQFSSSTGKEEEYDITEVSNVNISNCNIISPGGAGGVIGYGVEKVNTVNVNGCTIKNTLANYNGAGGIVGMSLSKEDNSITNSTVINSTITSNSYAGGIAGYTSGKIDNCTVTNTPITSDSSNNCVGGIAGFTYDTTSYITGSNVNDCNMSSKQYAGGIVGFTEGKIESCKVEGHKNYIKSDSSSGSVGGIVGHNNRESTLSNLTVTGYEISNSQNGSYSNVGGIVGFTSGNINDCNVSDTSITSNSSACLGGIVGMDVYSVSSSNGTNSTRTIENSTVSNCEISNTYVNQGVTSGYYVGGIVGFTDGTLKNDKVSDGTKISLVGENSVNAIGGILGMESATSGEIEGCSVDSITVNGKNGFVGGIVGESNKKIHDCDVSNSTIKSEGESSNGCGGIVGCGCSSTSIGECSIKDSTVEAHDKVNSVCGVGAGTSGCTVDHVKVIKDGTEVVESQESQDPQATSLEVESQDSLEIIDETLILEPIQETEEIEKDEILNPTSEEIPNTDIEDSKEELEQNKDEILETDIDKENEENSKDDTNLNLNDNLKDENLYNDDETDKKEEESNSKDVVEPENPDIKEPKQNEENEPQVDEEKITESQEPDSKTNSQQDQIENEKSLESSEELQMPKENSEQDLQQEKETSSD